jgi:hypothetical protein
MNKRLVEVFPGKNSTRGVSVTYSTKTGRKSFTLPRSQNLKQPLAVESFAQEPEHYYELMEAVAKLSKKQQLQGR